MRYLLALGALILLSGNVKAQAQAQLDGSVWLVDLETDGLGPVQTRLALTEKNGVLQGRSLSGAVDLLSRLPGAPHLESALFAFEASADSGSYRGTLTAPWPEGEIVVRVEKGQLQGAIQGSLFNGPFSGVPSAGTAPRRNYPALLATFDQVVQTKIFAPDLLQTPEYHRFRRQLGALAARANDDLDLLLGFRFAWTNKPFSHFSLRRSPIGAADMMQHFDSMRLGRAAAGVEFDGDIAVLRVETMMGNDTIEYIEAAYDSIAAAGSAALIIDLRGNGGGAFAVKPLVEHIIDTPLDAGYFVSQKWNTQHKRLPRRKELAAVPVWHGWSISAFWHSVQNQGLTRIRFEPATPNFDGPVFVLVDGRSASATELAVDALRASGLVTLVGEKTPGHMLSQSPFDVEAGFVVFLPVADYASVAHGRIEGIGVGVDIDTASAEALDRAKRLARQAIGG
jgi:carboxyl-terminal processing protease